MPNKITISLFIFLFFVSFSVHSQQVYDSLKSPKLTVDTLVQSGNLPDSLKTQLIQQKIKPKRRIIAAFLCLTLGPFGVHRLYLGTHPRVVAAYTLTLGGSIGIVPLIDLFHIVFSKDLSRFKSNEKFLMWIKD